MESVVDSLNNRQEFTYDSMGRNTVVRDALNNMSAAEFDRLGNVTKLVGPLGGATNYAYDEMGRLISESTASGGTITYGYNALNIKEQLTNARGQSRKYFYDAMGRITGFVGEEDSVSYTYDDNGNVLTVSDKNGLIQREYDALNRIIKLTDTFGKSIQYTYDAVGNLASIIYPDNMAVNYAYDANNNLVSVTDWANRVTSYTYDVNNMVVGVTKPDGSVTTTVYDHAQRIVSIIEKTASDVVITGFEYTYDNLSRIVAEKHLADNTKKCYTYDNLSRVTKRTIYNACNEIISEETFTYDAAGNITDAPNSCFRYDTNNRLIVWNGNSVSYDMDGNMLSNGSINCAFDSSNRLIKAGDHAYTYNAEDVRIRNLCSDADTIYTYNTNCKLSRLLTKTTNGITTKYVYGLGLIGEEKEGCFKTYHFDFRGSTVAITDECGNITDTFKYDTYGKMTEHIGNSFVIFGYNGRDGVITDRNGLLYMRARYYSPEMRRFVNADIISGAISNAVTLNRYAYANGNPVSNTDPFGLFSLIIIPNSQFVEEENSKYFTEKDSKKIISATIAAKEIGGRATVEDGTISINMDDEKDEIKRISNVLGMERTCDLIAEAACDKFCDNNGREFLLSDACVSKEILDHVEAYYWATGDKLFPNFLAFGYIVLQSYNKIKGGDYKSAINYNADSVYEATRSIDMREREVVKNNSSGLSNYASQSVVFDYKNGIRDEYLGTQYDPWADERK